MTCAVIVALLLHSPEALGFVTKPATAACAPRALDFEELEIGFPAWSVSFKLRFADVQRELKLSDAQIAGATELADEVHRRTEEVFKDTSEPRGPARWEKFARRLEPVQQYWQDELLKALRPEQIRRLRQIDLQARSFFACEQEVIRRALKIDEDQADSIDRIIKAYRAEIQQQSDHPEAVKRAEVDRPREEALLKLKQVLNEQQHARWQEVIGQPFKIGGAAGK